MTKPPAPTDEGVCIICMRHHSNLGYNPTPKHPVGWVCEECLEIGIDAIKRVYHMARKKLDAYEEKALEAGSDEAGAYLDRLGKTDLAQLEAQEWLEMWRVGLVGYADKMREIAVTGEAPF
jgi:hypothetical protein